MDIHRASKNVQWSLFSVVLAMSNSWLSGEKRPDHLPISVLRIIPAWLVEFYWRCSTSSPDSRPACSAGFQGLCKRTPAHTACCATGDAPLLSLQPCSPGSLCSPWFPCHSANLTMRRTTLMGDIIPERVHIEGEGLYDLPWIRSWYNLWRNWTCDLRAVKSIYFAWSPISGVKPSKGLWLSSLNWKCAFLSLQGEVPDFSLIKISGSFQLH